MNRALQLIRKFYVYIGARLECENALKILESDDILKLFWIHSISMTDTLALLKMKGNWLSSMKAKPLYF